MDKARQIIISLLTAGHEMAVLAEAEANVHRAEGHARRALAYFNAAATLLGGFGELHNEMIELPEFVGARRFIRRWRL
jgi:hypothetical protein